MNLTKNYIIDIINNYNEFFFNKKNVNGIALGHKIIKGIDTNEPCLTVFVENKLLENNIYSYDLIPKKFLGIKTDIIKNITPKISIHPLTVPTGDPEKDKEIAMLTSYKSPLQPGYAVSDLIERHYGTIGAIVFDNDTNEPYILSNNHVLAKNNELTFGDTITQGSNKVGYLHKQVFMNGPRNSSNNINLVDCATAKIIKDIPYTTDIFKIGKIKGMDDAEINMEVRKTGARTSYTTGTITHTNSMQNIEISNFGKTHFKDVIVCTKMSDKGDSGSLVVDSNNNAIGLLFADNETISLLNPIFSVIDILDIHF